MSWIALQPSNASPPASPNAWLCASDTARKTVTLALTAEQFQKMKQAVSNYRKFRKQLKQMEMPSRQIIFQSAPHLGRRKRLSRKVLGTK